MSRKLILAGVLILISGIVLQNCSESIISSEEEPQQVNLMKLMEMDVPKVTGEVEIIWNGGQGANAPEMDKRAFADFNAHIEADGKAAKGEFIFRVCGADLSVHREIISEVTKVVITGQTAWIKGQVISDSKGCGGGSGMGGHDTSCPGETGGGCGGDDNSHDGGCSGDHTDGGCDHTDGTCGGSDHTGGGMDGHSDGCSGDHTDGGCNNSGGGMDGHSDGCSGDHTDGGCNNSGGGMDGHSDGCSGDHTDGGCDNSGGGGMDGHSDGCSGDHTDGGCSGSDNSGQGGSGHSGGPKGKYCRVGQYIFIKVYDGGTPGTAGDEISWKWFGINSTHLPCWADLSAWHLCEKEIIDGNLVTHNDL